MTTTGRIIFLEGERDRLLDRVDLLERALTNIAAEDDLMKANEGAFAVHAFRRCQAIARIALDADPES